MKRLIELAVAAMLLLSLPAAARYGVKKTIPLGATGTYPHSLAFNPLHNKVYCSNTGSGTISVIDAVQDSLLANIVVDQPGEMVYAQVSDRLFVHDMNTELWAISGSGDSIEAYASHGQGWCELAYNQLQDKLYVSNSTDGLAFFTSSNLAYLGYNTSVNGNIFFAEPLQKLYGVAGLQVYVLDGASNAVIDSFAAAGIEGNSLFAYNPAAQKLYVTTAQGDLCVVNALNDDIITMLPLGAPPAGMAYCPVNNAVYVAMPNGDLAEVHPDESYNVYSTGGVQLSGVSYNPADSLIYTIDFVVSKGVNMLMLFDPLTQAFRDSVFMTGSNMYTNLVADNQGDVYTADYMLDQAYAVGRVPNTAWRSNPLSGYGSWHNFGDWEVHDSLAGWIPNPYGTTPSATDSIVLIQAGDTMAVDGDITVDELTVDGLLLHTGGQITVSDGLGVDIMVNGTFSQGTSTFYTQMPGSQWAYGPGAKHEFMGGDVDPLPIAFWDSASILHVISVGLATSFAGGTSGQQFGDILWASANGPIFTLAADAGFSCRDLQIDTGNVYLGSINCPKVTVRNYTQNLGWSYISMTGGGELEVTGDFTMNGGSFDMGDAGGIDTLRLRGNFYHNDGIMYSYDIVTPCEMRFDGAGQQQQYIFNTGFASLSGALNVSIMPGSYLYVGDQLGAGNAGGFTLSPGAILGTADTLGMWLTADSGCVRCTGSRTYGPNAGFAFSENSAPGLAGDAVAGNVSMLHAANSLGTALLASVTLSDSLLLEGPLTTGTDTLFMNAGATTLMLGGQVEGNLAKYFQTGSEYRDFEVGTAGGQYSPAGLQLYNSTQPGFVTVSVHATPHPQADSAANCLQRYWRFSGPGVFCDNSDISLNYLPGDFTATFTELDHESTMVAGRYGNGALPGWSLPAVLGRAYNGPADGGSITLAGGSTFDDSPDFTTGRDAASLHTIQDTVPPAAPESLQIYGFNPSYWLGGLTASVPVGWINPYDSTGIARAFYKTYEPPTGPMDFTDSIMVVGGARDTFWLAVDTLNGTMPVHLWLRDGAGNSNYMNTGSIIARRDTVAPAGAAIKPFPFDTSYAVNFTVNWSPGSDALSGIQAWRVLSRIDTSAAWDTLAPFTNDTSMAFSGALVGHRYYFEAAACDSAYNWEAFTGTAEASVYVAQPEGDTIPPGPPINLLVNGAEPMPWSNSDTIHLTWNNPEDSISAGYYKIGAAPTLNNDTTGHLTTLGGSADVIYDGDEGAIPLYLWLADSLGNMSYLNSAMATIRRDTTPPYNIVTNIVADTIMAPTFSVTWIRGNDDLSGISMYLIRMQDGTNPPYTEMTADTFYLFMGTAGNWCFFEAAAIDSAGNMEPLTGLAEDSVYIAIQDNIPPYVLSASPANGQVNVALGQPILIGFSEPVDTSSFRFRCLPENVTGWTVSWGGSNQSVTLTHDNFSLGTTYNFRVDSVADLAGNPMDTSASPNQSWSFTTVQLTTVSTTWTGGAWRLWSAPLLPQDTSVMAVLGDDLGAYSDTTWRLVGFKPSTGYVERASIRPGYGYWLASAQNAALDAQGFLLYGTQETHLESGWNMVGGPFDAAIGLSDMMVKWNDGISHQLPYGDLSVDSLALRHAMWGYIDNTGDLVNNGIWQSMSPQVSGDSLRPWQGHAVYAVRPCTLQMERFTKGAKVTPPPPYTMDWQLELSAFMGPWADLGLKIGVSPQASQGRDRLDAEKPPLVAENLAIFIPHHDWNQGPCHRYIRDIRPPGMEHRWTVEVQSDRTVPVRIDYLLTGSPPSGSNLYLVNRRLGQAQMLDRQGYVELGGGGQLEVICSNRSLAELEIRPLEFGLTRISPNPFVNRTLISYQLDRPGMTSLKVYNSLGQMVAILVDGRQEAGFHSVAWEGTRAAAGVYLVRLESEGRSRVTKTVKLR